MYVVLGASGRAGGETARALIEDGAEVRVVVRKAEQATPWRARGADVVIASIDDVDALARAFAGAAGGFLLNPPPVSGDPYARTQEVGTALAAAVRRAGLPRVVVLSSIGAQHETGTGVISTLNRLEALLDGAAPALVFLRPGYFVESWSEVSEAVVAQGVLPTFIEPRHSTPMVSTIDVGRAAAVLLREAGTGRHAVELSGPRDWSAADVAAAFSEILGRPVTPAFVPPPARAALLAGQGVPAEVADALLGMYEGIANGRVERDASSEQRRGTVDLKTALARLVAA